MIGEIAFQVCSESYGASISRKHRFSRHSIPPCLLIIRTNGSVAKRSSGLGKYTGLCPGMGLCAISTPAA